MIYKCVQMGMGLILTTWADPDLSGVFIDCTPYLCITKISTGTSTEFLMKYKLLSKILSRFLNNTLDNLTSNYDFLWFKQPKFRQCIYYDFSNIWFACCLNVYYSKHLTWREHFVSKSVREKPTSKRVSVATNAWGDTIVTLYHVLTFTTCVQHCKKGGHVSWKI